MATYFFEEGTTGGYARPADTVTIYVSRPVPTDTIRFATVRPERQWVGRNQAPRRPSRLT